MFRLLTKIVCFVGARGELLYDAILVRITVLDTLCSIILFIHIEITLASLLDNHA